MNLVKLKLLWWIIVKKHVLLLVLFWTRCLASQSSLVNGTKWSCDCISGSKITSVLLLWGKFPFFGS